METTQAPSNKGSRTWQPSQGERDKQLVTYFTEELAKGEKKTMDIARAYAEIHGGSALYHYRRYYYIRGQHVAFFEMHSAKSDVPAKDLPAKKEEAEVELPNNPSIAQTMVAAVQKLFDDILAENEKLRKERDQFQKENAIYVSSNQRLKRRITELEEDQNAVMRLMAKARQIGVSETAATTGEQA